MRIVIVGGLGYVGANAAPALLRLGEVLIVYRGSPRGARRAIAGYLEKAGAELVKMDRVSSEELMRLGADVYIHMAGKISGPYRIQWESHVGVLSEIVDAASQIGARVVYTSSTLAYGRVEGMPRGSEVLEEERHLSGERRWRSHHGRTKAEGERLLVRRADEVGGRFSILRHGLVVGVFPYHREWQAIVRLSRLGLYPSLGWGVNYTSRRALEWSYTEAARGSLDGRWVHTASTYAPYSEVARRVCEELKRVSCRGIPLGVLIRVAGPLAPSWSSLSAVWEGVEQGYVFKSRYGVPRDSSVEDLVSSLVSWLARN
ncbi:MAG: NAD(P)-dependent oxidoreductase [Aeropyrum sp.]|nr:NAD(P)-dependent oxidoreductase [Aeropyrum sp.]MCE4615787.1 NAD(P)-dependent oxidoreductase [Aeropyrum sp.]